jgi:hypothetical protein
MVPVRAPVPSAPPPDEPGDFTPKGATVRLEVWRQGSGSSELLGPESAVSAGDTLGFRVAARGGGHLVVADIDETGRVFPAWPPAPEGTRPFAATTQPTALDAALRLDATPGSEHLVALWCPGPLDWPAVQDAVGGLASGRPVPEGCAASDVVLPKAPP